MRRITYAVLATISALVALFSYSTSTNSQATAGPEPVGADPEVGTDPQSSGSGDAAAPPSDAGSYTGDASDTRWGPVQVRITVEDGKITDAEAVVYPTENRRDQEINAYAVPALNSEAVQQQSADIDVVSGATVTSDGYIESLQSAIDQANL